MQKRVTHRKRSEESENEALENFTAFEELAEGANRPRSRRIAGSRAQLPCLRVVSAVLSPQKLQ